MRADGLLSRHCCGDRVLGAPKRDKERVPLGVDFLAAGLLESRAKETLVVYQSLFVSVTELSEEARRPFHIGEQKADGPARKLRHYVLSY